MHFLEFHLSDTKLEDYLERTSLAVQCFTTIANIDFELIIPFITCCLPLLLQVRGIRVNVVYQFLDDTADIRYLRLNILWPSSGFF